MGNSRSTSTSSDESIDLKSSSSQHHGKSILPRWGNEAKHKRKKKKTRPKTTKSDDENSDSDFSTGSPLSKHVTAIVAKNIGFDWKKLGRQLALDDAEVESIAVGSNYGTEDMAHQVLYKWRQRRSNKATNRTLAENLEEIGRSDIANKIKTTTLNSCKIPLSSKQPDAFLIDAFSIVSKRIGRDWKRLARQLCVEDGDLTTNASNWAREDTMEVVLNRWQQRMGSKATITILAERLREIGRSDIADTINPNSADATTLSEVSSGFANNSEKIQVLKNVQTNLKENYRTLQLKGLPWMTNLGLTLQEYYVDLIMTAGEKGRKISQQLKLDEIFVPTESKKQPVRILIEGSPGSGKTTLAAKLAYDWAVDKTYIRHFDLVMLLPLRLFLGNLEDTLIRASSVKGIEKEYFLKLVNEESHAVLFILDGYDEASSKTEKCILPIIQKQFYPKTTVIITSRPGRFKSNRDEAGDRAFLANADVIPTFSRFLDKRVTVKGFNDHQQQMFVDKHMEMFSDEQKFNVRLKFAKMVDKEVLTCPLFLLMLIVLFTSDKDVENTETKTVLYKHLFNLVIKRYLSKTCAFRLDDLDLFSTTDSDKSLPHTELMNQFSMFALKALNKSTLIVSKKELVEIYKCNPEILELGFLTQYVCIKGFCESVLFEPVHKSLLEFAAAYGLYLSYQKNQSFPSTEDIIKFRPKETPSLFFPFLVGLMGENADVLFEIINSYSFEYSLKFEQLHCSLLETCLTEAILKSLTPFLPPEWNIFSDPIKQETDEGSFLTSSQHEAIVRWGVQQNKICQINWNVSRDVRLPTNIVVDTLTLYIHKVKDLTDLMNAIRKSLQHSSSSLSQSKLHCKYLWCYFSNSVPAARMVLEDFSDLLQFFDFQLISIRFVHASINTNKDLAPQRFSYAPVKHTSKAPGHEKLRQVHFHSVSTGIIESSASDLLNPPIMRSVSDLIKLDRIEVLDLHVVTVSQREIDSFTTYAAESIKLRTIVLSTTLSASEVGNLPFVMNLTKLCNGGQKSWKWVELCRIRVECSDSVKADLLITHLEITSCAQQTKLINHFQAQSLNCDFSLLSDTWSQWPCQASIAELNVHVDVSLLYRGISAITDKLRNLQILALTMTSLERNAVTLPFEEWIRNAISGLRLKGFEIWRFSKNTSLANALVVGLIKCLEEYPWICLPSEILPQHDSNGPFSSLMEPTGLQYLMVSDIEGETGLYAANYFQRLKSCICHGRLERVELVFSANTKLPEYAEKESLFSKLSIKQAFPCQEGFRVEHDLWGSREHDSIYSKGKHCISGMHKSRISISFKQTGNSRRATVPNVFKVGAS